MSSVTSEDGSVELFLEGSKVPPVLKSGAIAGLTHVGQKFTPELMKDFDALAGNLIFEMNRLHSTGTPSAGFFSTLTSAYAFQDSDNDGQIEDELISNSQLPFDVQEGRLNVNVTRQTTGELKQHQINIDPASTSVGDFLASLNEIEGINANLNSFGRLQVFADAAFGFDFAAKLDPRPDKSGTMGGGHASLGTGSEGPYALADGHSLDLTGPVSSFSVAFSAADFVEISSATAEEVALVLNANADVQANGLRAVTVDGRVYIQTAATGASADFQVSGGSSIGAFEWTAGMTVTGHDFGVEVEITGDYIGESNGSFTFIPRGDGMVGTTPGLEVDVFSSSGQLVATLDVGDSYQPGTALEVDAGIEVSFGYGDLSATHNDSFRAEVIADSDTSDVLAAIGLNAMFTGTGAEDIAIREDLDTNPERLAAGVTGAVGDNQALLAILDLQTAGVAGLGGESLGDFYGDVVSDVGFEISTASTARDVEEFLLQNLEQRREQISGVSIDEELVEMIRFEQSFAAASRYIQVLNDLSADILSLI
jgi:flagellar hook-associated protein FlgK